MCKISINNMLWLALMSVIQNQHLPMLLDTVNVCISSCQELYHSVFFSLFFTACGFEKDPISDNFKANNGYFLMFLGNFRFNLA